MNGERICEVCGIEIEELAWQHTPLPEGASAFEVLLFPVAACGPYSIALTPNASTESEAWTVSFPSHGFREFREPEISSDRIHPVLHAVRCPCFVTKP